MELFRALGSLIESPLPEHTRVATALNLPALPTAAEHARVVVQQRYPYRRCTWGWRGCWGAKRATGLPGFGGRWVWEGNADEAPEGGERAPGADVPDREADHLASLLGLLAALEQWRREESDPARQALLTQARATLLWEHLASWTGPYLASFEGCGVAFYEVWASLVDDALARLNGEMESPGYLPAALRGAPGFADPRREGGAAFIASLLAPLRSGVILLRDDLERLGDEVGLACRAGERRYVLNAFLAQDPGRTLQWLARHAESWSERVTRKGPAPIAAWWSERAAGTALVLKELAGEVQPGSTPGPPDPAPAEPGRRSDRPTSAATTP